MPTLPADEAQALVQDLLANNAGCRLPCWWGITPGETSWSEAHQFLAAFAMRVEQGKSGQIVEEGITYQITHYRVTYDIAGVPQGGGASFSIKNGIISTIYIGPASTVQGFQLHQLLTAYGKPEKVLLKTYTNTPELYLPFRLVLFYPSRQILALYEYEAQQEGEVLKGCPQPMGPMLWLWRPNEVWTDKDIEDTVSGPNTPNSLRSLEEVTDLDRETFYQMFKDAGTGGCIETPAELWP